MIKIVIMNFKMYIKKYIYNLLFNFWLFNTKIFCAKIFKNIVLLTKFELQTSRKKLGLTLQKLFVNKNVK